MICVFGRVSAARPVQLIFGAVVEGAARGASPGAVATSTTPRKPAPAKMGLLRNRIRVMPLLPNFRADLAWDAERHLRRLGTKGITVSAVAAISLLPIIIYVNNFVPGQFWRRWAKSW